MTDHIPTGAEKAPERQIDLQVFNPRIEALRGVAALSVAAFHASQTRYLIEGKVAGQLVFDGNEASTFWNGLNTAYSWLLNGQGAVVLFFVISGFVLSLSLDRMSGSIGRIAGLFLLRRLLRLWPPVFFMVAVFAAFHLATGYRLPDVSADHYAPLPLLRHAFLQDSQINGVVWTLQVEAFAAPVILFAWMAARRRSGAVLWTLFFVLCLTSFAGYFDRSLAASGLPPAGYIQFLYAFIAGMLIPSWADFVQNLGIPRRFVAFYPVFGVVLILAAPHVFGFGSNYRVVCQVLGSMTLVTGVALGMTGVIAKVLDRTVIRFYGRISYSFYLLHPLTLTLLWNHPEITGQFVSTGIPKLFLALLAFVISVAAITPLAALSYVLVEAPSIRLSRRLGCGWLAPALSPETARS